MQNDILTPKPRNNGKVIAGFILLVVGGVLLLQQVGGYLLPSWVFSFPMLLLAVGLYVGAKNNFRNPAAYIMVVIAVILLLDDMIPGANLTNLIWPVIIISVGILMILGRNQKWIHRRAKNKKGYEQTDWGKQWEWDKKVTPDEPIAPTSSGFADTNYTTPGSGSTSSSSYSQGNYNGHPAEDYLDATSIFGSANKTILTKNFRGGEIINVFGGAEIDFTQADINGRVVIDVTQIFGGIKLLVPPHWHVTSDMVALFAGFDDKRKQKTNIIGDKVLVLTGTSIFAGVEIRSY